MTPLEFVGKSLLRGAAAFGHRRSGTSFLPTAEYSQSRRLPPVLGLACACLLIGLSCTTKDLDYCADGRDCPGMMRCDPIDHVCLPNDGSVCTRSDQCTDPLRSHCDEDQRRCVPCIAGTDDGQ